MLSVSIKRGANTLLARNLLGQSIANWTFGQLLAVVNCWPDENVTQVAVSKNEIVGTKLILWSTCFSAG